MEESGGDLQSDTGCSDSPVVAVARKVFAELIGTYLLVFAGCCSVVLNHSERTKGQITFPGICIVWGLSVTILVYSLVGVHLNPAVTASFAIYSRFPLKMVPLYFIAQVLGSFLASETLYVLFKPDRNSYFGTTPAGGLFQSLVLEFLASFLLMFVVSAVSTDNRAVGKLGGIAVGMTIVVDVFIAGPVSGASMNPARSLGPALVMNVYDGFWIYIVGPFVGAILGATCYNFIRHNDKALNKTG